MSAANKDKRTKEQLLQILSNALNQEEQLGEKIKMLENELAVCQKQNEDSRAEINQYGLSASKESFRIDYYKTTENGRLKGIIEHLPTRQKKSFKGLGIKLIAQFMERFLPENIPLEKVAAPVLKTFPPAPEQSVQAIDFLGNMVPLVNGQEPEDLVVTAAENTPATIPAILEIPAAESTETGQKPSLAQRLREQMQSADLKAPGGSRAVVQPPVTAPSAATAWELPKTVAAIPERQKEEKVNQPEPVFMPVSGKSRLLERLQEEFQADSLANLQSGNK